MALLLLNLSVRTVGSDRACGRPPQGVRAFFSRAFSVLMESKPGSSILIEHDLFRKPASTFRNHALMSNHVTALPMTHEPTRNARIRSLHIRVFGIFLCAAALCCECEHNQKLSIN